MTTEKRQLRLVISAILEKHGIDNLALEISIVDAVVSFFEQTKRGIEPVKARGNILDGVLHYLDKQREYEQMTNRIAKVVKVTPNGGDAWNEVVRFCIAKERQGQTIEQYGEWMHANRYDAPKVAQISMRPQIIKDTWIAAFSEPKEQEDAVIQDDEPVNYVPNPYRK